MREFTDVEYDILDILFFVEPWDKILEEVDSPANIVKDGLRFLIEHKFVTAMTWDEEHNDYKKSNFYDADNMSAYYYLATRKGLLAFYVKNEGE